MYASRKTKRGRDLFLGEPYASPVGDLHDVIALLLAAGANPNVPMDDGSTPMCYAKSHDYTEAEQLLRTAGARGEC